MTGNNGIRIEREYRDAWGNLRSAPDETVERLDRALQHVDGDEGGGDASEDHRCFEPPWMQRQERRWGIAVQLYGLRSPRNWGIGDFTDLRRLIALAARQGADFVGVNPLHALYAADPSRYSPYSPSSREFLNVLYLDPEEMQSFAISAEGQRLARSPAFRDRVAALRAAPLVEYEQVARLKDEIFRALFSDFAALCAREPMHPMVVAFTQFAKARGETLRRFAIFQALSCREGFGANWMTWPEAFRDPAGAAVHEFAASDPLTVGYHEFLQWEADAQLATCAAAAREAGMEIGLYLDIAVGTGPESTEGWSEQSNIVPGFHIGAPPDLWNTAGQDWGLAVFDPYAMRRSRYVVFRRILRAMMQRAAALRIDHVLGFYRLFVVPAGTKPSDGVYLRLPADAICNALAEESTENRCLIIGEDLGTVPEDFPALLAAHNILSYRLLIFARDGERFLGPEEYLKNALVSISTHDLPPFLGYLDGTDIETRARLGLYSDDEARQRAHAERAAERQQLFAALNAAGLPPGDDPAGVIAAAHAFLARTPCTLLLVQMEELAMERDQPNLPGSDPHYPNWRRKLSRDLDAIFAAPSTETILAAVRKERPGRTAP